MRQSSGAGPIGGRSAGPESKPLAPQPTGIPEYTPPSDDLCLLSVSAPFPRVTAPEGLTPEKDELKERIEQRLSPQSFAERLLEQLSLGQVPEPECAELLREIALLSPSEFAAGLAATESLIKRLRFDDPCMDIPDEHLAVEELPLSQDERISPLPEILRVALSSSQVSAGQLLVSLLTRDSGDRLWSSISRALDFHLGRTLEPRDIFDIPARLEDTLAGKMLAPVAAAVPGASEPRALSDIRRAERDTPIKSPAA